MNKIICKKALPLLCSSLLLTGCIEEVEPTTYASKEQIARSTSALDALRDGLDAYMVTYDSYGSSSYEYWDWGYPCQMVIRDVMCEDFPTYVGKTTYDYFESIAENNYMTWFTVYGYAYYYKIVYNADNLIKNAGGLAASDDKKSYAGVGYAYRAMAYLDMARMYEYKQTGFASLDDVAQQRGIYGLTVPIVTEATTSAEARNNPRAPFYTMYRFILSDLNSAASLLQGYSRSGVQTPDTTVVNGLKARFWLELASRFDQKPADLAIQLQHEGDADGYAPLGITSAADCYAKAAECAQKAMEAYQPVTRSEWYNAETGFNKANASWMWAGVVSNKEQLNSWYYTWMGTLNSEASYTLANYGTYRCISDTLFRLIPDGDWRKKSWIDPEMGVEDRAATYTTILTEDALKELPSYANLKYHPGSGNTDDYQVGLLCDIPFMRMEEMEFIYLEAIAHTLGWATASAQLASWLNAYRYDEGSTYTSTATSLESFVEELMVQKRIELWGEGLVYFDYKRLGLQVKRNYATTNFQSRQRLDSKAGYVAPWLNYTISMYEDDNNAAVAGTLNPDPSGVVTAGVAE